MADTKISALTDGVTANATDAIPVARSGANVYVTPAYIRKYLAGNPFFQTLTDAATIAWDVSLGTSAKVTLGGNRTLGAPTNMVEGQTYVLRVIQDGTGSRTLAYNSVWKWPGGVAPTLSTAIGAVDVITGVSDGTNIDAAIQKAFG